MNPVSIILPTLNERDNIAPIIELIRKAFDPEEIIVVDDNSSDGTLQKVLSLQQRIPNLRCIHNNPPVGLATSIRKGIEDARAPYVAWMDADFSHPPRLLVSMFQQLRSKRADIVVGSWLVKGGKDNRKEVSAKIFSFTINKLCQFCFGATVHAYTSGYILARKSVLCEIPFRGDYGEYCIDLLVRSIRSQKKIVEIPFVCTSRRRGKSKTAAHVFDYILKGKKYIVTIVRLAMHR